MNCLPKYVTDLGNNANCSLTMFYNDRCMPNIPKQTGITELWNIGTAISVLSPDPISQIAVKTNPKPTLIYSDVRVSNLRSTMGLGLFESFVLLFERGCLHRNSNRLKRNPFSGIQSENGSACQANPT